MISLLLSFLGLLGGIILALIAPEELKPGRKYFYLLKRILFLVILIIVAYFLFSKNNVMAGIIFTLLMITIFLIALKKDSLWLELIFYLLIIIIYFQYEYFQTALASLLFCYGMPLGTILKLKFHENKKRPGSNR